MQNRRTMGAERTRRGFATRWALIGLTGLFLAALLAWALVAGRAMETIEELLLKNKELQEALTQLTEEERIGYAKVTGQFSRDGRMFTAVKFVATLPGDPLTPVFQREYEVPGDVVYFDALIVRFSTERVLDGRERALYLWRRLFSEGMEPAQGFPLENEGGEPERYQHLLAKLPVGQRQVFWTAIWDLANDPQRLAGAGVTAIYGNAVYVRMQPGVVYLFNLNKAGQITPVPVLDF